MKFKTIMRYHFIGTEIAITQHFSKNLLGCGETGMLLITGGKVNWYSHFGKIIRQFHEK